MLTIRLARVGKTKQPQYRVVVADHRRAVTGRFVDVVGHVNPLTDPATVTLKNDKVTEWLGKGARPSETVQSILIRENILKAPKNQPKRPTKAAKNPDKYGKAAAPAAEATPESADESASEETEVGEAQPVETPEEGTADAVAEPAESAAEPEAAPEETPAESPSVEPDEPKTE